MNKTEAQKYAKAIANLPEEVLDKVLELDVYDGYGAEWKVIYDVILKPGWAMEDMHMFLEPNAKAMAGSLKRVTECRCVECRKLLGGPVNDLIG